MTWTNTLLLISLFSILLANLAVCSDDWSYTKPNGPSTWPKTYPICGGKKQSPINIIPKDSPFDGSIKELAINYSPFTELNVTNNGKAITARVSSSDALNFTGAGLPSTYILEQFQFHVGSDNSQGSEHQIKGKKYPMEMHLVHYGASKSPSITAAVMSVLFTEEKSDNPALNKLIESLQNCSYLGQSTQVPSFSVRDILPKDTSAFYRYSGSFTTPQCNESVEWIVFHQTVSISTSQIQKFRNVFSSTKQTTKPLVNNFRPVQPLNGRIVQRNFDHPDFNCGKKSNLTADCRQTIDDHDVFYEVQINPCTLPVSVVLKISSPSMGFNTEKTLSEDLKTPLIISNLKYGASLEMHFHADGANSGQLHVTVYQFPLAQATKTVKVIDEFFQVEGVSVCQRGNCTVDTWDKHWCSSKIGIDKPLLIGFSSTLNGACGSPSVAVDIYRSEFMKQSWVMTSKQEFKDKQTYLVNLTNSLVDSKSLRMRKAVAVGSKWTSVYLEAHVEKLSGGKTNFEVYLLTKSNGGHYLVFNTQYINPSGLCSKKKSGSQGKKVAVGVIIVVVLVLIIGAAAFILYKNRRAYQGHRPALVDEIEVEDADRL